MSKGNPNVLRDRNFFLLFFGTVFSNIGTTLFSFAASFYMLKITDNNALLQGAYLAVCGVTFLVCSPIGGVLADRWNRVRIVYMSDFIKGAAFLIAVPLFAESAAHGDVTVQVVALFALGFINNMIGAIFSPASSALIPALVPNDKLQQANSYFTALNSLQSILGVVLAGVLYAALPIQTLFALIGGGYVISAISEIFIHCEHRKPTNALTLRSMVTDYADGIRYLKSIPALLMLLSGVLFINFFTTPYYSNANPYFFRAYLTGHEYLFSDILTPEMWSSITSVCASLGTLAMSLYLSMRKPMERVGRHISRMLLLNGAVQVLMTLAFYIFVERGVSLNGYLISLSTLLFVFCGICTAINVPASTALQRIVPSNMYAKVTSLVGMLCMGITPLASLLGGAIIERFGLLALLAFCSIGLLATAIVISSFKRLDEI